MSTFGADIGRILRSPLPALTKLAAVVLRYHAPDGARAERIAEVSGIGRAKTFAILADLRIEGVAEKRDDRWHYSAPTCDMSDEVCNESTTWTGEQGEVHHMDKKSTTWTPPVHDMDSKVHHVDSKVHHMDSPPAPPNKVLQTFSRPSPDVAADAHAPATPSPDFLAVERTYLDATGGGLMVKSVEAVALKTLADTHGPAAVITAIEEAVLANTRGRVSVNFVRAILERKAGTTPTRQEPRGPGYVMPPDPNPLPPPREETEEERAAVLAAWREI